MGRVFSLTLVTLISIVAVGAREIEVHPRRLDDAYLNKPYTAGPLVALSGGRCPLGPVAFSIAQGRLPEGLDLDGAGYVRGTPLEPGPFHFVVAARSVCGETHVALSIETHMQPVLLAMPARLAFEAEQGARLPASQQILLSGNVPGLAYTIESFDAPWVKVRPRAGRLPASGAAIESDVAEVLVDTTKLSAGTHTAHITAHAFQTAHPAVVTVTVVVRAAGSSWDGVRTTPMVHAPTPLPIVIVPPAYIEPPAPKKPAVQPSSRRTKVDPNPAKSSSPVVRSRVVPIRKIPLAPPKPGLALPLGAPEELKLPAKKEPAKALAH